MVQNTRRVMAKSLLLLALFAANLFIPTSFAGQSIADLEQLWEQSKDKPGYSQYLSEFTQYNNHHKLDSKDNCYNKAGGRVNMYLIINSKAKIESVITDVDNAKAQCFKKTYTGLLVKTPPFSPFIIPMTME